MSHLSPELRYEAYEKLEGANFSTTKELDRSPTHYLHALENGRELTGPLEVGLGTHLAVFEPVRFKEEVAIWPDAQGRRFGKAWDAFVAQARLDGKLILREKDRELVLRLADAVHASPQAREYLALKGEAEKAFQWTEDVGGEKVRCKGRLDWRCPRGILDLKSVQDASPDGFGRAALKYLWYLQGAWYQRGDAASNKGVVLPFAFCAVEKAEPHVVQVYTLEDEALELGNSKMDELLGKLVELRKTWKQRRGWPGYSREAMSLQLPAWAWGPAGEASIEMLDDEDEGHGQEPGQEEQG